MRKQKNKFQRKDKNKTSVKFLNKTEISHLEFKVKVLKMVAEIEDG